VNTAEVLSKPWLAASADLGIQVERLPSGVVVTAFGSPAGTLCSVCYTADEEEHLRDDAQSRGSFCSVLADSYLTYDRHLFVGTLDDWGWFGEGSPPAWYTGAVWGA
jgi:hypothetical protein